MTVSKKKDDNPFDLSIEGVYGRFKTIDSFEVDYLLSNISVEKLDVLKTAADAFDFDEIDFEEIMQRDVDYKRVLDEIVNDYLMKSAEKAVFFPPIIVSVVALDESGKPLTKYSDVVSTSDKEEATYTKVWEKNRFAIELLLSENDRPEKVAHDGKELSYYKYASTLKLNTLKVKLVVIDGQHRFVALQKLFVMNKDHVENIELPVCFVFTPYSSEQGEGHENVVSNFRQMFVTINTEAKKVGGHFTTLLRDRSLTSMTIRALANGWKKDNTEASKSYLQMLEWNERSDSKSNQRMRPYSITTVGILADIISSHFFSRKTDCSQLLYLDDIKEDLKIRENSMLASSIGESDFDNDQSQLLEQQIEKYIVPALDYIFRHCIPYQKMRDNFEVALKFVEDQEAKSINGYREFRKKVLSKFRRVNILDDESVETAQNSFDDQFVYEGDEEKYYFYNVFQHGVLGNWKELSVRLCGKYSLNPLDVAEILVAGLNSFGLIHGSNLYDRDREFCRYTLYNKSGRPNVSNAGKSTWINYLALGLLSKSSQVSIEEVLVSKMPEDEIEPALNEIEEYLKLQKEDYLEGMEKNIQNYVAKEWAFGPFDQDDVDRLHSLKLSKDSSDEDEDDYDETIHKLAKNYFSETVGKLEAVLSK